MQVLLLSSDPKLISTMQLACAKAGISLTLCSDPEEGAALLTRRKMYAVAVDDAGPAAATKLLNAVSKSSSSKTAVTIAFITGFGKSMAGGPAASFVVTKPVSTELALRTLRAAQSHMATELRRYFRYPLGAPVAVTTESNQKLEGTCINISQRGIAVQFPAPELTPRKGAVHARFALPPGSTCIELRGEIAWSDGKSKAGLRCQGITKKDQTQLEKWLAKRPINSPGDEGRNAP